MKFENHLQESELKIFESLNSPFEIQKFLDSLPYVGEDLNRSPLRVMHDRQCHCLDGGILAALALSRLGHTPLILDLAPEPLLDDDHVLAIFRQNNGIGAIAKSNFVGLRYREPVYRTLRELVMSYFEEFYNINGMKTLRGYTRPLNLSRYDRFDWATRETGIDRITRALYSRKIIPVITPDQAASLVPVDRRSYEAGMLGTDFEGLYKPAVGLSGDWSE